MKFALQKGEKGGRGGEKVGSVNFKTKHTKPFTQEITPLLYATVSVLQSVAHEVGVLVLVRVQIGAIFTLELHVHPREQKCGYSLDAIQLEHFII